MFNFHTYLGMNVMCFDKLEITKMSYWTVSNAFLSYPVSFIAKFVRINEASYLASSDSTL